jgi:hypothetical protein
MFAASSIILGSRPRLRGWKFSFVVSHVGSAIADAVWQNSERMNAPSRDRPAVRFGRRASSLRERAREESLLTAIRHGRAMRLAVVRVMARAFVCRARRRGNNRKRKARAEAQAFRFFVSSRQELKARRALTLLSRDVIGRRCHATKCG